MSDQQHRARKRFGQNFLQDHAVIERIITSIITAANRKSTGDRNHFVEIGPGQGALTYPFIERIESKPAQQLTLLEIDRDLAANLRERLGKNDKAEPKVELIETDALQFDFIALARQHSVNSLSVFGNLPYNISTPLIFHLLDQHRELASAGNPLFNSMTFMLQKEVVDRICAQPNTKAYGRISIMTQLHCRCEKLFDVPPSAFKPAPKVTSSIVQLTPEDNIFPAVKDQSLLGKVVKLSFAQRRKTLRNNLNDLISADELTALNIDPGRRAETLAIEEYISIANYLSDS